MTAWLHQHLLALRKTFERFVCAPFANILNVAVFGIALSLPAGFYLGLVNLEAISLRFDISPELTIFMNENAKDPDRMELESRLKNRSEVNKFQYVSRAQALDELKKSADFGDITEALERNPLPDSIVVGLKVIAPSDLETLRNEVTHWPQVEHVQIDTTWAQKLEAGLKIAHLFGALITALLSFGLVAIMINTIRLQILTQREEIEVAKFIGATNPFIRRPFLYQGAIQGLLGGAAAWVIVVVIVAAVNHTLKDFSGLYSTQVQFTYPNLADGLSVLAFAAWLGWLGAWVSVSQYLWRLGLSSKP